MNKTRIEYADYTWNPVTGCLGPEGTGKLCDYCYAARLARGRLRSLYLSHRMNFAGNCRDPFAPRFWKQRLDQPYRVKQPSRIFVCDMADLFGPWVARVTQDLIMDLVRANPRHTFLFLTKWPRRLPHFNPWPENAWVGATATCSSELYEAGRDLFQLDAKVIYASLEPLLAHVEGPLLKGLDWVIIGAQTGPGAIAPKPEWVEELLVYADHYGIPVFLKDNLRWQTPRTQWPKGAAAHG